MATRRPKFARTSLASPLGTLSLVESDGAIVALDWGKGRGQDGATRLLAAGVQQLNAYFYCELREFDLPLAPAGSAFQTKVWDAMRAIPYGQAASYGGLARALRSAPRAIGGACGRNPIPILIPCHRVLGAGGAIGGYSGLGGLAAKRFLLALEGRPVR